MGFLKILKVEYAGDKYYFESPSLDRRLVIVEGPNGSGKSTFFGLIYYGLGGKVSEFDPSSRELHPEIVGDTNNIVRLLVSINSNVYTLTRKVRENLITVFRVPAKVDGVDTGLESETLPINRHGDSPTFSDWLFERLAVPVVEIFQGARNFKLNISDLLRLVYHNQSPDPLGIYKSPDNSNYVTDSLEIRRAIFQILVGKTQLELYQAIGEMKLADRNSQAAKMVYEEYKSVVEQLLKAANLLEVNNSKSLQAQLKELDEQISKLLTSRDAITSKSVGAEKIQIFLQAEVREMEATERLQREKDSEYESVSKQAGSLMDIEQALKSDIERINKVIYTHSQLNLFSSETCPFCLNSVSRAEHKCVCGNSIDEADYQRFFYSPAEYLDILRSKTKTLETVRIAAGDIRREYAALTAERESLLKDLTLRRERIFKSMGSMDAGNVAIREIDAKILEVRERTAKAQEALRLEIKLELLRKSWSTKKDAFDGAKALVERLDAASKEELRNQIAEFDRIYNEFMTTVVAGCRVAAIDTETYLPVINDGEYKEASASVSKRFLYYLTLLQLSLLSEIPFPRLLLIDTPETAGIDKENLVLMLRQISNLANKDEKDFQIILSTGEGKYPPEYKDDVVLVLSKAKRLLNLKKPPVSSEGN